VGNLNLLNEEDFLEHPGRKNKSAESSPKFISENDLFDDIMIERKQIDEEESVIDANLEAFDEDESEPEQESSEFVMPEEKEVSAPKEDEYRTAGKNRDYVSDDESFESNKTGSKKYLWLILAIVILGTSGYFIYTKYFPLSGEPEKTALTDEKKVTPTPEEIKASELQAKRNQKLDEIVKQSAHRTSVFNELINQKTSVSRIEVIIMTEDEILFEVFSKTRDGLAKLNMQLKKSFPATQFEIIASRNRTGDAGGVIASYRMTTGTKEVTIKSTTPFTEFGAFNTWLENLAKEANVKITRLGTKNIGQIDGFDLKNIDLMVDGSSSNIMKFVTNIGKSARNISVENLQSATSITGNTKLEALLKLYL